MVAAIRQKEEEKVGMHVLEVDDFALKRLLLQFLLILLPVIGDRAAQPIKVSCTSIPTVATLV